MKTVQKAVAAALAVWMFAAVFSICAYASPVETVGDYLITVGYDQGILIKQYKGHASNLVIPSQMTVPSTGETLSVFGVDANAFESNLSLISLTMPDTMLHIGQEAFLSCTNMTSVLFNCGLKEIGVSAFSGCSSLQQVVLPSSLITLGSGAFDSCAALETVDTGDGIENISNGAFSRCASLYKATIGLNVTTLGDNVFLDCDMLAEVRFNAKTNSISESCFDMEFDGTLYCYYGSAADMFAHTKGYEHKHYKLNGLTMSGPDKTTYYIGEPVILDGLSVQAKYEDAPSLDVTDKCVVDTTYEDEDGRFITVTYTEGAYSVTKYIQLTFIEDSVTTITITRLPDKCTYYQGDIDIILDGITLEVTHESGEKITVTDTNLMTVSGFDNTQIGTQTVSVNFGGKSVDLDVTVLENNLTGIRITRLPDRRVYYVGDTGIQLNGITLEAAYESGKKETVTDINLMTVSGFNGANIGTQTVSVSYGGQSASFDVTVKEDVITGIAITKLPDTLTYRYKERNGVKLDGITLEATYESGRTETVTDTSLMTVTGFNNTRRGTQTVSVVYGEQSAEFNVEVVLLWWQWIIKIILFGWIWY